MPTRPRTGTGRTKKKTAPAGTQQPPPEPTEVTAAHLERREIPSFSESREARIAEAAYWRAEKRGEIDRELEYLPSDSQINQRMAERRGFVAGQELDDWLAAEKEVDGDAASRR